MLDKNKKKENNNNNKSSPFFNLPIPFGAIQI